MREILEELLKKSAQMGMLQTQGKISFEEARVFAEGHIDHAMEQVKNLSLNPVLSDSFCVCIGEHGRYRYGESETRCSTCGKKVKQNV